MRPAADTALNLQVINCSTLYWSLCVIPVGDQATTLPNSLAIRSMFSCSWFPLRNYQTVKASNGPLPSKSC